MPGVFWHPHIQAEYVDAYIGLLLEFFPSQSANPKKLKQPEIKD
jgi:hypothetical protein